MNHKKTCLTTINLSIMVKNPMVFYLDHLAVIKTTKVAYQLFPPPTVKNRL